MTISTSQSSSVGHGNGATTSFNYGFLIPDESTLVVIYTDAAGVQTILSPTQFSVTGLDNPNGGAVTYPLAGPAIGVGTSITIQRAIPYTQPTRLANQAGYFPQAVEGALDWLEMQIQQAVASINTGLHYPAVDVNPVSELVPAAARAGKFFAFDGNGNPTMLPGNLLSGDLAAYTIFGAAFNNTHLAANYAVGFDHGWFIEFNTALATDVYGMAIDIEGTGGAGLTVNALLNAANQNGSNRGCYPLNTQAWNKPGGGGVLVAAEFAAINETNNFTGSKWGCDIVWKDRPDGVATVVQGLGADEYNLGAFGLVFDSQARSTAGEKCGWRRGIYFTPDALDADANGAAIGIDFAKVRFYGGTNPLTAYRMTAAIRMNAYQTILWNGDPTLPNDPTEPVNPIRTYFASAAAPTGRWVITNTGVEIFGVDVVTGGIYINGVLSSGVTLAGNNTWTGTNTFNNAVTIGANLTFSGTARRLLADFTNATLANRFSLQSSTVNGTTEAQVIPNGTGATAAISMISDSAVTNASYIRIAATTGSVAIGSGHLGGGVTGPILITIDAAEVARYGWNGTDFQYLINTISTSSVVGCKMRVNGIVVIDNACAFMVHKNGVDQTPIANTTFTQVTFSTKEFDQDSIFNTATGKLTPKAGKYLLSASIGWSGSVDTARYNTLIYKNGAAYRSGIQQAGAGGQPLDTACCIVVDANGTDYFEVYAWQNSGAGGTISGTTFDTWFCGHRIG